MREARRDGGTEAEVRRPNITRYLFDATICTVNDFMCRLVGDARKNPSQGLRSSLSAVTRSEQEEYCCCTTGPSRVCWVRTEYLLTVGDT